MSRLSHSLPPAIDLHILPAPWLQTTTLWVCWHRCGAEHTLPLALLAHAWRAALTQPAASGSLAVQLYSLGATLDVIASRRGPFQSMVLALSLAAVDQPDAGLSAALPLLSTLIDAQPFAALSASGLAQAQNQVIKQFNRMQSQPQTYGFWRCQELLNPTAPLPSEPLSQSDLSAYTAQLRAAAPLAVYVAGPADPALYSERLLPWLQRFHSPTRQPLDQPPPLTVPPQLLSQIERQPAMPEQATLGLASSLTLADARYAALQLGLSVWAAQPTSRLQTLLRAQLKQLYQLRLHPDPVSGAVYIALPVAAEHQDAALDSALGLLRMLQSGDWSAAELRPFQLQQLREAAVLVERPQRLIDHWLTTDLLGAGCDPATLIATLRQADVAAVAAALKTLKPAAIVCVRSS